jgi:hypothetical protein
MMRDLTKTELDLVTGGQSNSITATLSASNPPGAASITVSASGAGLSGDFTADAQFPKSVTTSATVTESNSTP